MISASSNLREGQELLRLDAESEATDRNLFVGSDGDVFAARNLVTLDQSQVAAFRDQPVMSFVIERKEQFGTDTPVFNKLFYNSRGQLAEVRDSTSYGGDWDTSWNRGAIINHYSDNCWGMCGGSNSTTPMTDNNGNLKNQDVYIPNDEQVSSYVTWRDHFDYDPLNRLQRVHEYSDGTHDWQQEYVFDRWGNRTIHQTNTWGPSVGPPIPKPNFGVDTVNNRLTPPAGYTMTFDNAGNQTYDNYSGQGQRTYDAENRMTQAWANNQWQVYTYDGEGQRVRRKVDGVEAWQVYGLGGELIAEYAANASASSPQKEYGYRNGQLLITATSTSGDVQWLVGDQLGTPRMIFDKTGWLANTKRHDYLPFGEELIASQGLRTTTLGYLADNTRQKFTQKERDIETGLDFFEARYYASTQGRFTSPDPVAGSCWNPQSLNAYSYAWNNPLKLTDPTGMTVSWEDSEMKKKKDETTARTEAQRKYEKHIQELLNSKDPKKRAEGEKLQAQYERLQKSDITFHVVKSNPSDASSGELTYAGKEGHLYVNLKGDSSEYGALTDVQKLAHEFTHGEQFLDGKIGFITSDGKKWHGYRDDLPDEAEAFIAGFDAQPLDPAQRSNKFLNDVEAARGFGLNAVVDVLAREGPYTRRSRTQNVFTDKAVNVYAIPRHK